MFMLRSPKLFLHHVGESGLDRDAPQTLFRTRPIEELLAVVPSSAREETREALGQLFPSGQCHCWGVPAKADKVMRHLQAGDYVLFLRSRLPGGDIPVCCWVKYVFPMQSLELSRILWGEEKYPLIFLFDAELLNLGWEEFREQMRYKENYDPRGCFVFVSSRALAETYGGVKNYIAFLRRHYAVGVLRHPAQERQEDALVAHAGPDLNLPRLKTMHVRNLDLWGGSEEMPSLRQRRDGMRMEGVFPIERTTQAG